MTIKLDEKAYEHIKKKGGSLTVDLISPIGCCGGLPVPSLTFTIPKKTDVYEPLNHEDVTIYVRRGMRFEDDVVELKLGRTLFFKDFDLPTLRLMDQ